MPYNVNDPDDNKELAAWLNGHSDRQWQEYLEFAFSEEQKRNFSYDDRDNLKKVGNFLKAQPPLTKGQFNSAKWAFDVIQRIEHLKEKADLQGLLDKNGSGIKMPLNNFTFRVAWHDSAWNGHVCKHPDKNIFCNGYHSLLSDRIRKNKEKLIDTEMKYAGQPVSKMIAETGEFPPCFWSINVFGEEPLSIKHVNPAASYLNPIEEQLPPYSIFSWPFAFSFVRDNDEYKENGKYPANLEKYRVPRFEGKIKKDESIGIVYAKYSNPLSYEDMKYLVVACGKIADRGSKTFFGPEEDINNIRNKRRDLRNFPKVNWALRFSFDPDSLVRMPYHEYQDEAKRRGYDAEQTQNLLEKIRVTIDEPELESCFKYVVMDIDDDETIYILTKMRATLIESKSHGILEVSWINEQVRKLEDLLEYCWNRRTHFPGFGRLSRVLLGKHENEDSKLDDLVTTLKKDERNYSEVLKELLNKPRENNSYATYQNDLLNLKRLLNQLEITTDQFLTLAMLNISTRQFQKISEGLVKSISSLRDAAANPYLLYEEYEVDKDPQDSQSGDFIDSPIELFKIDIALFPNANYLSSNYLQDDWQITDARRVRSLVIQHLRSLELTTGDCFDDASSIESTLRTYPLFFNSKNLILPEQFLITRTDEYDSHLRHKLYIDYHNDTKYYYLNELKKAEEDIGDFIKILVNTSEPNTLHYEDLQTYIIESVEKLKGKIGEQFDEVSFSDERNFLYENLFPNRFFVLCGNPGSGKSYEILNIIRYFHANNESYLLLTPTGKASLRLMYDGDFEDVDIEAMTIDKFINDFKKPNKRRRFHNVIVDEASMVDLVKFDKLLRCFDADDPGLHRLILVGDPHQLPPIGFGKPFYDIIQFLKSEPQLSKHIIELDVNCRQELKDNAILDFCKVFTNEAELSNSQLQSLLNGGKVSEGFFVRYWKDETELIDILKSEWLQLSADLGGLGALPKQLDDIFEINGDVEEAEDIKFNMERFQIITPYRFFADKVNLYFQKEVRNNAEIDILKLFKSGDKIIRSKNYYVKDELILSNGSIGVALNWEKDSLLCFPELQDGYLSLNDGSIRESEKDFLELAYGITVHKAQGSGFDHVIVILPKRHGLLCKELFYTALSRSKQSIRILIEGEPGQDFEESLFEYARKRTFTENRKTSLLLDSPYRYYGLEPEPRVFVQSRVEQIIYRHLMDFRNSHGDSHGFTFAYEQFPQLDAEKVRIKTDFTIYTKRGTYYWEHLGMLNKPSYRKTWLNVKKPTYEKMGLFDQLITTDELRGISDEKIVEIITKMINGAVDNEDRHQQYSNHHFSLR